MEYSNPFAQAEANMLWHVQCDDESAVSIVESAIEELVLASARVVGAPNSVKLYLDEAMSEPLGAALLRLHDAGYAHSIVAREVIEKRDWVAEAQASFQPMHIGRFYVHDSNHRDAIPADAIAVEMNAGAAFGTGEHATTSGCLAMIDALMHEGLTPMRLLDMGCGTALLGIAAAKCFDVPVVAVDCDAQAVRVSEENAELNHVHDKMHIARSDGYDSDMVRQHAPYDVIVANILAEPLKAMATDAAAHLAQDGVLILSGILERQADDVTAVHEALGLHCAKRDIREGWAILRMEKR